MAIERVLPTPTQTPTGATTDRINVPNMGASIGAGLQDLGKAIYVTELELKKKRESLLEQNSINKTMLSFTEIERSLSVANAEGKPFSLDAVENWYEENSNSLSESQLSNESKKRVQLEIDARKQALLLSAETNNARHIIREAKTNILDVVSTRKNIEELDLLKQDKKFFDAANDTGISSVELNNQINAQILDRVSMIAMTNPDTADEILQESIVLDNQGNVIGGRLAGSSANQINSVRGFIQSERNRRVQPYGAVDKTTAKVFSHIEQLESEGVSFSEMRAANTVFPLISQTARSLGYELTIDETNKIMKQLETRKDYEVFDIPVSPQQAFGAASSIQASIYGGNSLQQTHRLTEEAVANGLISRGEATAFMNQAYNYANVLEGKTETQRQGLQIATQNIIRNLSEQFSSDIGASNDRIAKSLSFIGGSSADNENLPIIYRTAMYNVLQSIGDEEVMDIYIEGEKTNYGGEEMLRRAVVDKLKEIGRGNKFESDRDISDAVLGFSFVIGQISNNMPSAESNREKDDRKGKKIGEEDDSEKQGWWGWLGGLLNNKF